MYLFLTSLISVVIGGLAITFYILSFYELTGGHGGTVVRHPLPPLRSAFQTLDPMWESC